MSHQIAEKKNDPMEGTMPIITNVITLLEGHQQTETIEVEKMELNLKPETPQNSLNRHRLPLPLELNCQIFECLKVPIQKKFICGLGRGIYGIFRQKLLAKSKRLRNHEQNAWNNSSTNAIISFNGIQASDNTWNYPIVFANKGFSISGQLARKEDNFPGTILYYFEVAQISDIILDDCGYFVGLSDGHNCDGFSLGITPNSYCISDGGFYYYMSGVGECRFEWQNGVFPKLIVPGNVAGCGLVLNPKNNLSIFFTWNGILLGKQIPISPSVDCLYPTLEMCRVYLEANFGNDPAKPFQYNIEKCPGMDYD